MQEKREKKKNNALFFGGENVAQAQWQVQTRTTIYDDPDRIIYKMINSHLSYR